MNFARQLFQTTNQKLMNERFKVVLRLVSFKVRLSGNKEKLEVETGSGTDRFPLVWLRDNCRCEECYHSTSSSRTINWNTFNVDVSVKEIQTNNDKVLIHWDDNHKSMYDVQWLQKRSFSEQSQEHYLTKIYRPPKKLWSKNDFSQIMQKHYQYNDVINNKNQFCNWIEDLIAHGVVLMKNSPLDPNVNRKLVEKIAFMKKTHYGADFQIKAKPGTQNVAYLSSLLQLHTDLPYYTYAPGVTTLHCIEQTKATGGENLLTDVFYVAEHLRRENREVFNILSSTLIDWIDIGEEDGVKFHKIAREPVIGLDLEGNVSFIRHSIPQRDSRFTTNIDNVKPWYRALRVFTDAINDNAAKFKLDPGDFLTFDNIRLVHGRLSYEDTEDNQRLLIGCYVDWDEVYSKWRVLKAELGDFS